MKQEFLNYLIGKNKGYLNAYISIFRIAEPLEKFYNKDLSQFNKLDLKTMFTIFAKDTKIATSKVYISLIKSYKEYVRDIKGQEINEETLTVKDLEGLKFKQYTIINDTDMLNMTEYYNASSGDLTVLLLLKLVWETSFVEGLADYLSVKDSDINIKDRTVKINNNIYTVSEWLITSLDYYLTVERVEYNNKRGSYPMVSLEENKGYVFRKAKTKRGTYGVPLTTSQFSNMLYKFSEANYKENINMVDIKMSLAVKHMVGQKKSPLEMVGENNFFKNMTSNDYTSVFQEYAEKKYPELYKEYIDWYKNI